MKERLQTAAAAVVLLAAGFLLGSFWLEWRGSSLAEEEAAGDAAPSDAVPARPGVRPRVEVLNGMGRPGAARRAAGLLREMGFDVVYYGNADRFDHARTRVLLRSTDSAAARRVADSLGVDGMSVRPEPDLYVDGTVILGADWDSLRSARERPAAGGGFAPLEALMDGLGL